MQCSHGWGCDALPVDRDYCDLDIGDAEMRIVYIHPLRMRYGRRHFAVMPAACTAAARRHGAEVLQPVE
jgi:hypothetical protein